MDKEDIKDKIDNIPGCVWAIIIPITFGIVFSFFSSLWYNCGEIDRDEVLEEKVELPNESYIYIIHSWHCTRKCLDKSTGKPKMQWFKTITKLSDFIKYKYSVYDYCIDSVHAAMLNAISNAYVSEVDDYYLFTDDDMKSWLRQKQRIDTSSRDYDIYYSIGDSLLPLPEDAQTVGSYRRINED